MPHIQVPPIEPIPAKQVMPDLVLFAKAYFGIELTQAQIEYLEAISNGREINARITRRPGVAEATKVLRAYIKEGLDQTGRARLPQIAIEPRQKLKSVTQSGKILEMIKRPGGAFNFELSRIALKYDSRISELREDGHDIIAERQYLKNGRASNTWKYYLIGD